MMRRFWAVLICLVPMMITWSQDTSLTVSYTYQNVSGNRYIAAISGSFPDVDAAQIQFDGMPLWVVGGLVGGTPTWVVALDDGRVLASQSMGGADAVSALSIEIDSLSPEAPIAVGFDNMGLPMVLKAGGDASALSHPAMLSADNTLAYVAANGDLVLWREGNELDRVKLNIQPDARLVVSDDGQIAVYANATDERYVHGIMGDDLEGSSLVILDVVEDKLNLYAQVDLPDEDIFEGLSPFWADVNDDGIDDLVTTVSNGVGGALVRVYNQSGEVFGESRPIGQGERWRHQLAAGPFGIDGEMQVVDMRTPHIGGMVEFFSLRDGLLSVNNAQLGYTSHPIGSRNLDMGVAGDFDGDGTPELVVTNQSQDEIVAVINSLDGVKEVWRLPLNATLSTNLAAVSLANGSVALAAGTDDGLLHVWISR